MHTKLCKKWYVFQESPLGGTEYAREYIGFLKNQDRRSRIGGRGSSDGRKHAYGVCWFPNKNTTTLGSQLFTVKVENTSIWNQQEKQEFYKDTILPILSISCMSDRKFVRQSIRHLKYFFNFLITFHQWIKILWDHLHVYLSAFLNYSQTIAHLQIKVQMHLALFQNAYERKVNFTLGRHRGVKVTERCKACPQLKARENVFSFVSLAWAFHSKRTLMSA